MVKIPKELFTKKTTGFLALGIALYLISTYLNTVKENVANVGQSIALLVIIIALIAQIINWIFYWRELRYHERNR